MAQARLKITKKQFEGFKSQLIASSDDRLCCVTEMVDTHPPDFCIPLRQMKISDYVIGRKWFSVAVETKRAFDFRYDVKTRKLVIRA